MASSSISGSLFITGNDKADALLNTNYSALLIGLLLDQQIPMEWAFAGPLTLKTRLGHFNIKKIAEMDADDLLAVCLQKPAIHRFPASMAKRIHDVCKVLTRDYKGKAENMWADITTAQELMIRLRALPGFGEEKSQIFVALIAKRMDIKLIGWKTAAGEFGDNKFRTVADITSPETLLKVRATKKAQKAAGRDKQDKPLR